MEGRIALITAWVLDFGRRSTPYAIIAAAAMLYWVLK